MHILPCFAAFRIPRLCEGVNEAEIAHCRDHMEDNPGVLVYNLTPAKNVREGFLGWVPAKLTAKCRSTRELRRGQQ